MRGDCGEWVVQAIKFIAMTSSRIDQATRVLKSDVKLDEGILLFRKEIIKGGLKADARDVAFPLYPELKKLCLEMMAKPHRRGDFLLPVRKFRVGIHSACKRLGLPHWTPHDFRHLFGTKILSPENQQHISITQASQLFFHKDGGKLMLERYAHVIRQQLQQASAKITMFEKVPSPDLKAGND